MVRPGCDDTPDRSTDTQTMSARNTHTEGSIMTTYYVPRDDYREGMTADDIEAVGGFEDFEADSRYRDMLDDVYGVVTIAGMEYDTGSALQEVDPTAFRVGVADYLDDFEEVEISDDAS